MKENPLLKLHSFGQDVWLDTISRHLMDSGELEQLINEDRLCGVTSNPEIFDKAIEGSGDYDSEIQKLAREARSVEEIYQALTTEDIKRAADLFRPTFESLGGRDGFVSLEVNPHLAKDVESTVQEAKRLWAVLDRPNVFIKVPATIEGLQAIRELISEGINVNVTLLFGLARYRRVAEAYLSGLEARAARGLPIDRVSSVASFFLSRIDVLVDPMLENIIKEGAQRSKIAGSLRGQIAVSSAKMAYRMYKEIFGSGRFKELASLGARPQRVLWASTGTKNPEYSDVKYVEELIGPETVNTMPLNTLKAYRDHGKPAPRLEEGLDRAAQNLERLSELGIDLDEVTQQLEEQGIEKFNRPYDSLIANIEKKRSSALGRSGEWSSDFKDKC